MFKFRGFIDPSDQNELYHPITIQNMRFDRKKQEHKVSYRCSLPAPSQKGSQDSDSYFRNQISEIKFGKPLLCCLFLHLLFPFLHFSRICRGSSFGGKLVMPSPLLLLFISSLRGMWKLNGAVTGVALWGTIWIVGSPAKLPFWMGSIEIYWDLLRLTLEEQEGGEHHVTKHQMG